MSKLSKTKLLMAGLLTGALAFGTACKSDSGAERGGTTTDPAGTTTGTGTDTGTGTGTDTGTTPPPGTGGAGSSYDEMRGPHDHPASETEPGAHEGGVTDDNMGVGGAGDESGVDRGLGTGGAGMDDTGNEGGLTDDNAGTGGSGTGGEDMGGVDTDSGLMNEGGNPDEPLPNDADLGTNQRVPDTGR